MISTGRWKIMTSTRPGAKPMRVEEHTHGRFTFPVVMQHDPRGWRFWRKDKWTPTNKRGYSVLNPAAKHMSRRNRMKWYANAVSVAESGMTYG